MNEENNMTEEQAISLIKKMGEFLSGSDLSLEFLERKFNIDELVTFFFQFPDFTYAFGSNSLTVTKFLNHCFDVGYNFFSNEEATVLHNKAILDDSFSYSLIPLVFEKLTDEQLYDGFLNDKDCRFLQYYIDAMKSDDILYKLTKTKVCRKSHYVASAITRMEDEELREKLIGSVPSDERYLVIGSLSDIKIEKHLSFLSRNKGSIIASFQSDELKEKYLKRYSLLLNDEDNYYFFF